jgi:aspartate racemase
MNKIGVLGGMGPAATADFLTKLVQLTPATCDQEHLPVVVANLPHVPDRSRAILGLGPDPLPAMFASIDLLVNAGCGVIAVPCNTSHHWHSDFSKHSPVPVLHIAKACVEAVGRARTTAILGTRGCLQSGFYQRTITEHGGLCYVPDGQTVQPLVDATIAAVKAGDLTGGARYLEQVLRSLVDKGVNAAVLACTELPLAASCCDPASHTGMTLVDSTLELARASVQYGLDRGWNLPSSDMR